MHLSMAFRELSCNRDTNLPVISKLCESMCLFLYLRADRPMSKIIILLEALSDNLFPLNYIFVPYSLTSSHRNPLWHWANTRQSFRVVMMMTRFKITFCQLFSRPASPNRQPSSLFVHLILLFIFKESFIVSSSPPSYSRKRWRGLWHRPSGISSDCHLCPSSPRVEYANWLPSASSAHFSIQQSTSLRDLSARTSTGTLSSVVHYPLLSYTISRSSARLPCFPSCKSPYSIPIWCSTYLAFSRKMTLTSHVSKLPTHFASVITQLFKCKSIGSFVLPNRSQLSTFAAR